MFCSVCRFPLKRRLMLVEGCAGGGRERREEWDDNGDDDDDEGDEGARDNGFSTSLSLIVLYINPDSSSISGKKESDCRVGIPSCLGVNVFPLCGRNNEASVVLVSSTWHECGEVKRESGIGTHSELGLRSAGLIVSGRNGPSGIS